MTIPILQAPGAALQTHCQGATHRLPRAKLRNSISREGPQRNRSVFIQTIDGYRLAMVRGKLLLTGSRYFSNVYTRELENKTFSDVGAAGFDITSSIRGFNVMWPHVFFFCRSFGSSYPVWLDTSFQMINRQRGINSRCGVHNNVI